MCLKDETLLPENNDVVYGWKVLSRSRGGLRSFWRDRGRVYTPLTREKAELFYPAAGFYFYPTKKNAQAARKLTAEWDRGMGYSRGIVVVAFCRFEGILAKGLDDTSFDWPHSPAMRAKYMEIIEVVRSHKKKEGKDA